MKIAISGSTGWLGSALMARLASEGHEALRLVRKALPSAERQVRWNPSAGSIDAEGLEGLEAVVHLAGEPIAGGRWTEARKRRIAESRVQGTALLAKTLAGLQAPPRVLVCASAIGYYGDRGDEPLIETSPPGDGFLAEVCQAWELAARPAVDRGIRVVQLRIGIVLSPSGGALALMLPPFRLGLGGTLGGGKQVMSWIALEDVLGAISHALTNDVLRGPVNATAPHPVANREFTHTLGRVLGRPTILPVPPFALRALFGEFADEALLAGARVLPAKLQQAGYRFRYPDLEPALRALLPR